MSRPQTWFGNRRVTSDEKSDLVQGVFRSVAERYDVMNDLMSFGLHRIWKRLAVDQAGIREGANVLDLASGTGDLAHIISQRVGPNGRIIAADFSLEMLEAGRNKAEDAGWDSSSICRVVADAHSLPIADQSVDAAIVGFGLRNFTTPNAAFAELKRVLKIGGRLTILEFSSPRANWIEDAYHLWTARCTPWIGGRVTGDRESYDYLYQSIERHPTRFDLASQMRDAGFEEISAEPLCAGVVAIHSGMRCRDAAT